MNLKQLPSKLESWEKPPVNEDFRKRYKITGNAWNDGLHGGYLAWDKQHNCKVIIRYTYSYPKDMDHLLWVLYYLRSNLNSSSILSVLDSGSMPSHYKPEGFFYFTEKYDYKYFPHITKTSDEYCNDIRCAIYGFLNFVDGIIYLDEQQLQIGDLDCSNIVYSNNKAYLLITNAQRVYWRASFLVEKRDQSKLITGFTPPEYITSETDPPPFHEKASVYFLGGMLLYLLYRKKPLNYYQQDSSLDIFATLYKVMEAKALPEYHDLQSHFWYHCSEQKHKELLGICQKAIQPLPENRFASVRLFRQALQDWLQ